MDLLEDILKYAGLRTRVLGSRSFMGPTSVQFPCSKSIGFHVVTQGLAFIHQGASQKPIRLNKGDIALMARGCDHVISTEEKRPAQSTFLKDFDQAEKKSVPVSGKESKPQLSIVSGAYQLWNDPVHPFFREIPDWFILRAQDAEGLDTLQMLTPLLGEEVARPQLGSDRIVQGLLDIMFSLIIRKVVDKNSSKPESFSHAIHNQQIKHAIELLHSDCARAWTLEELAGEVGLSRAGFALKFKKAMGDTPLHYLTTVRIQKAMELLSTTELNIENVALQVGYQDAFGFSKAFKKIAGLPPRDFRTHDQQERKLAWRF